MVRIAGYASILAALISGAAAAQDPASGASAEAAELKAKNDLRAEQLRSLELENKFSEETNKRVTQLGLPTYDGTRELTGDAGKMEAGVLAVATLASAADVLRNDNNDWRSRGTTIVLASGENVPALEIEALYDAYRVLNTATDETLSFCPSQEMVDSAAVPVVAGIAVAKAIAGLLRSNVTYSSIAVTGPDSALFADMLAQRIDGLRPAAPLPLAYGQNARSLKTSLNALEEKATELRKSRMEIEAIDEKDRTSRQKTCLSYLNTAVTAHDTFAGTWHAASSGALSRAATVLNWLTMLESAQRIVVVDINAGGTAANRSNIGTFFGADPLLLYAQTIVEWREYVVEPQVPDVSHPTTTITPRYSVSLTTKPEMGALACVTEKTSIDEMYRYANSPNSVPVTASCRRILS